MSASDPVTGWGWNLNFGEGNWCQIVTQNYNLTRQMLEAGDKCSVSNSERPLPGRASRKVDATSTYTTRDEPTFAILLAASETGVKLQDVTMTDQDGWGRMFDCYIENWTESAGNDSKVEISFSLRISGTPTDVTGS